MVASLHFNNNNERSNTAGFWNAFGEYTSTQACVGQTNDIIIEGFAENVYDYSFSYALYAYDASMSSYRLMDRSVVMNHRVPSQTSKATKVNISDRNVANVMPMRLILTDMTTYTPSQPVLALSLVVNDEDIVKKTTEHSMRMRIPAVFNTQWSEVPNNRQLDMQLPPMSSLTIEYDLSKMRL